MVLNFFLLIYWIFWLLLFFLETGIYCIALACWDLLCRSGCTLLVSTSQVLVLKAWTIWNWRQGLCWARMIFFVCLFVWDRAFLLPQLASVSQVLGLMACTTTAWLFLKMFYQIFVLFLWIWVQRVKCTCIHAKFLPHWGCVSLLAPTWVLIPAISYHSQFKMRCSNVFWGLLTYEKINEKA